MGDWEVRTDPAKNRLYLTLDGYLDGEEMEAVGAEAIEAGAKLDDGFEMVVDLSTFNPTDEAEEQLQRGQEALGENISAVVRVTAESTVGQMQWDRAASGAPYEVAKAESVEDAEQLLDSRSG